ncbi:hypothetical protein GUITHDRAFT_148189 [Guillardia theta CCMP2712]|uniref:Importin subunit alpha n=1 Tax=Guillardia theta (strain CCMP2712) TaxID=905079 RepID=L1IB06_GUITC|nr:hypothetical protein GUITHDRAFT_148189 [Guillardia theta CCMP2712]EKX33030.1 hypothetical protein GUITHDRAFT_148189 [Guillardia theta CCMP2712]|eukprot:XP_005820010.1 hypothetical protein GUITHDRAFT_148189 [Guillardia theta CCMP2712]
MAGEDEQCRDTIRANGAIRPIINKLNGRMVEVQKISAWALANLMRGQDPKLDEFFAMGLGEVVVELILTQEEVPSSHASSELMVEVVWLLSILTHNQEKFALHLCQVGVASKLVRYLESGMAQLEMPALRCIGNMICGPDEITDHLLSHPACLKQLHVMLQTGNKGLMKEATWVLSNIAAGKANHRAAMMEEGVHASLIVILKTSHFDIRKEAAFALFHLLHDPAYTPTLFTPELATEFVGLLRAPDPQVVDMALTVAERILATMEGGPRLFEEADGIDALEQLIYANSSQAVVARSSFLGESPRREGGDADVCAVDKYFGEDAEPY